MSDLLDDLEWRGLVADSTDREALEAHLAQGPVTFYVGFDPTAKSLHIGHLVQLMLVRALQERGHKPLLLVGGATGLIGDPKMTGERHMNDREVVAEWVESIKDQVSK
ncbi:tyrosine--tRNA ligase, partial [Heyndrickxia coagulans DSM 1 = ATCC 7050]|nr:tyrosine--tRNA ligase [Heyndrickxia coagulans DSM 1 = ATCC 7050]